MTRYQEGLSRSRTILTVSFLILCGLAAVAMAQGQDAADDREAVAYVEQQARQAAQPDTWPKLVAKGCAMVACDRMRSP